jgi:hypothetical protein
VCDLVLEIDRQRSVKYNSLRLFSISRMSGQSTPQTPLPVRSLRAACTWVVSGAW